MTNTPTPRKFPDNISDALNTLSYRLEKTESDFIGHLQKVENKLEQIADLARTVALLQQQANQQSEIIGDVKNQQREFNQKIENSVKNLESKIDELTSQMRDRVELSSKESSYKISAVAEKTDKVEQELKKWLNRGIGAWVILTFLAAIIQTFFYQWVERLDSEKNIINQQMTSLEKQDQQISQLSEELKQQQNDVKELTKETSMLSGKLDQMSKNKVFLKK